MIHFSSGAQKLGWGLGDHSPHVTPHGHPASLPWAWGQFLSWMAFSLGSMGVDSPSLVDWELAKRLSGPHSLSLSAPVFL